MHLPLPGDLTILIVAFSSIESLTSNSSADPKASASTPLKSPTSIAISCIESAPFFEIEVEITGVVLQIMRSDSDPDHTLVWKYLWTDGETRVLE